MKFPNPIPVADLADQYGCVVEGKPDNLAKGINVIHSVEPGDITFVDVPKYYQKSIQSAATVILIDQSIEVPPEKTILIHPNPFAVYEQIIQAHRQPLSPDRIPETIHIHPTAQIEDQVIIREHVSIGAHTVIRGNVYIDSYTTIGNEVIIEPGCNIGTDAFYYKKKNNQYIKWTSGGQTVIEDNVEVGAGSTINKGVSSVTRIGRGTKIDCQVHIGHGCQIGEDCLIAAQVGVGGKTKIGNRVILYGQVGIAQNLTIGDDVIILAKSGISKNLDGAKTYFGYPAGEVFQKNRELASLRKLPEIIKKMK